MYLVGKDVNKKYIENFGIYENIQEAELLKQIIKSFLQYDVKIYEI